MKNSTFSNADSFFALSSFSLNVRLNWTLVRCLGSKSSSLGRDIMSDKIHNYALIVFCRDYLRLLISLSNYQIIY